MERVSVRERERERGDPISSDPVEIGYPNGDPYVCEGLCPPQLGIELLTDNYFNWSLRSISPLYQFMTLGYHPQVSLPHILPQVSP